MLNKDWETFVMHIVMLKIIKFYLLKIAQIAILQFNMVLIETYSKYIDFTNVILPNFAMELLKNTSINKYTIKLVD